MNKKGITYVKKFRQGVGVAAMNAIDYYRENGQLIEHKWANGGSSKRIVISVPSKIDGYKELKIEGLQ